MSYKHEFGIINNIKDYKEDEYTPEKFNCISVDGDFIDEIYNKGFKDKIDELETFAHNINRPYKGLAYYGTTLIPPASLNDFLQIISDENIKYNSKELTKLTNKILEAIKENKWIIHYGI